MGIARALAMEPKVLLRGNHLPRPRNRVELAESTQVLHYRKAVIDFQYTRQAHVEKTAA